MNFNSFMVGLSTGLLLLLSIVFFNNSITITWERYLAIVLLGLIGILINFIPFNKTRLGK